MKNSLCRNEILEPGEIINAYHTFDWGGQFLGIVKLVRLSDTNGYAGRIYHTWKVIPMNDYTREMYTTILPVTITPIIDD